MRKDLKKMLKAGATITNALKNTVDYDKIISAVDGLMDERFNDFTNDSKKYAELIINTVFIALTKGN